MPRKIDNPIELFGVNTRIDRKNQWFVVDMEGLAKVLRRRRTAFVLYGLVQNALDTETERVEIELQPIPKRAAAKLTPSDSDPDGFKNLDHAYTQFAESKRKDTAEKRGSLILAKS